MRAHALVHSLAQTWVQIGRNPAAALGNIAPNIGSIVAIEKDQAAQARRQIFPTFLALNSNGAVGPGLSVGQVRAVQGDSVGRRHRQHHQSRPARPASTNRFKLLHSLDDSLRTNSPNGAAMSDYNEFYIAAKQLMYNPMVNRPSGSPPRESTRFGSTGHGQRHAWWPRRC